MHVNTNFYTSVPPQVPFLKSSVLNYPMWNHMLQICAIKWKMFLSMNILFGTYIRHIEYLLDMTCLEFFKILLLSYLVFSKTYIYNFSYQFLFLDCNIVTYLEHTLLEHICISYWIFILTYCSMFDIIQLLFITFTFGEIYMLDKNNICIQ
jgi:hypothetical protein